MSVWPAVAAARATLAGSEGSLVSVSVHVEARFLEALLEALARVEFPINPQIYHDAAIEYRYANGDVRREPTTLVEFPAYEARLDEVRGALQAFGFSADCLHVADMLEELHQENLVEAAPPGAEYVSRTLVKQGSARIPSV
ncbi:MAG: hypothetical protein ACE15B_00850 [Bryobacteraceae bacterium]